MAQFSISPRKLGRLRREAARAAEETGTVGPLNDAPQPLQLQWLAKDKQTKLGEPFVIEPGEGEAAVEAFHPSGEIEHVMAPVGLDFEADAPSGAKYLQLTQGEASDTIAFSTLEGPGPRAPDDDKRFHSKTALFVFPVFAERFADAEEFFAAVDELYHWIMALAPFSAEGMDKHFALHGYYWKTNEQVGQFKTKDIVYNCALASQNPAVTFNGNNADAKAALGHLMREQRYGLVLINSKVRGGAGGMAAWGYPAWASITSCPGESWQAVALHEIGHALGLADEYLDTNRRTEKRDHEPNCATSAIGAPWHTQIMQPPGPGTAHYTLADQAVLGHAGGRPNPGLDFVGLFEGARYRGDYFRPSLNCLMKQTDCLRFCRICEAAISKKILGGP